MKLKLELGKVTWPTRKETIATTWVVVIIVFLISLYLGACDLVLAKLMRLDTGLKDTYMAHKVVRRTYLFRF